MRGYFSRTDGINKRAGPCIDHSVILGSNQCMMVKEDENLGWLSVVKGEKNITRKYKKKK